MALESSVKKLNSDFGEWGQRDQLGWMNHLILTTSSARNICSCYLALNALCKKTEYSFLYKQLFEGFGYLNIIFVILISRSTSKIIFKL